ERTEYAYAEKELAKLIERLEEEMPAEEPEEPVVMEEEMISGEQGELFDQADVEPEAIKPRHDVIELPEAEAIEAILARVEKLGLPVSLVVPQEFEIDPANPFDEYHPFEIYDGQKRG